MREPVDAAVLAVGRMRLGLRVEGCAVSTEFLPRPDRPALPPTVRPAGRQPLAAEHVQAVLTLDRARAAP